MVPMRISTRIRHVRLTATAKAFDRVRSVLPMSAFHDAEYKDGGQNQHQRIVERSEQTK